MRLTTAALLTLAAAHIRCYDYEDYDYFPEPGPPQAHDLPPGTLDDAPGDDVVVRTRLGAVLGRRRTDDVHLGAETNTVEWFLGIPYAEPPTGDSRFKAPVEKRAWRGTRRAVRQGAACPQAPLYQYTDPSFQSEDCLFLNVYAPYKASNANRTYPVMVYLHGGSYEFGAAAVYSGNLLAQHGVVVVGVNYRLGLLGFLTAQSEHLQGNYGLLDQIEALKWVSAHIAAFRGDPRRVTVFGNSAGGASTALLTMSPLTPGLFHRAIVQSGAPLSFWAVHNRTVDLRAHARAMMALFGCDAPTLPRSVDCMRRVPWQSLMSYDKRKVPNISPSEADFKPCVDGHVIRDVPKVLLESGSVHPVALLTGTVKDEWTRNIGWFIQELYADMPHLDEQFADGIDRATFEHAIDHVITKRFGWPQSVADVVKNTYTNWSRLRDPLENRNQYVHFFTDLSMIAPTVATASYLHRRGVPVHLYTFNHHSPYADEAWWGSYHSVELNFVFGSPFTGFSVDTGSRQSYTDTDRRVSARVMTLWTNFAKHGDPTPSGFGGGYTWEPFRPATSDYLHIGANTTEMRRHLRAQTVAFWNELVPALLAREARAAPPPKTYRVEMWLFVGISVALLFLLLLALVAMMRNVRSSSPYRFVRKEDAYNGAPVRV